MRSKIATILAVSCLSVAGIASGNLAQAQTIQASKDHTIMYRYIPLKLADSMGSSQYADMLKATRSAKSYDLQVNPTARSMIYLENYNVGGQGTPADQNYDEQKITCGVRRSAVFDNGREEVFFVFDDYSIARYVCDNEPKTIPPSRLVMTTVTKKTSEILEVLTFIAQ